MVVGAIVKVSVSVSLLPVYQSGHVAVLSGDQEIGWLHSCTGELYRASEAI